jgi:hypothetical protein
MRRRNARKALQSFGWGQEIPERPSMQSFGWGQEMPERPCKALGYHLPEFKVLSVILHTTAWEGSELRRVTAAAPPGNGLVPPVRQVDPLVNVVLPGGFERRKEKNASVVSVYICARVCVCVRVCDREDIRLMLCDAGGRV